MEIATPDKKLIRQTRFPGSDENHATRRGSDHKIPGDRQTRFPGGLGMQELKTFSRRLGDIEEDHSEEPIRQQLSLPLKIHQPDAASRRSPPKASIEQPQGKEVKAATVKKESPWKYYTYLRLLERGGQVTAACTLQIPTSMVVLKKVSSINIKELAKYQHENLLSIMELYDFQGSYFAVTDYTAATLKQIIAISLQLEEIHVSATCRQIFEGMQHLSRFGIAHGKLDSSKILFTADGCAKISHLDDCHPSAEAAARPLGAIAMEMMQNGIPPDSEEKLVLKHRDRWSPEASNFLDVTSWGTLKDIQTVRYHLDLVRFSECIVEQILEVNI